MTLKKNLQAEIAALERVLVTRRRMLGLICDSSENEKPMRPKTKVWLLRDSLEKYHPEGIALRQVPNVLKEIGFITKEASATTNWLRQPKPHTDFFIVKDGWVKLRDNLRELDEKYGYTTESGNGASRTEPPLT